MGYHEPGMGEQLKENLRMLELQEETSQTVWETYKRKPAFFERAAKEAYAGELPDYPICKRSPLERLVIWFRHLEHGVLFKLGTLQFQLFRMVYLDEAGCGEAYMSFSEEQKQRLPPESPVLNVHVQAGADLTGEAVANSFRRADVFFQTYFPEHKARVFLCYSWLLYPDLRALLPPESRIAQFAQNFTIISQVPDPEEALERIYGKRRPRKADCLQETSLQRAALNRRDCLGYACGILEIPQTT